METKFVNLFVLKTKQERILFELFKKRNHAIDRFAHNSILILNQNKIVLSGEKLQQDDIIKELFNYVSLNVDVYVIACNEKFDKQIMKLSEAIMAFFDDPLQMIITDGEKFALIKEELSGNYSQKYLLINHKQSIK